MRVRALTASGDMQFGGNAAGFYQNQVEAVGQIVRTRLLLFLGEFFTDLQDGTPWKTQILGRNTTSTYDEIIRARILTTIGVTGIVTYSSVLDRRTRALTVTATIATLYGTTVVTAPVIPTTGINS